MPGQTPGRFAKFAAALRANPDTWAVLPGDYTKEDTVKSTASNIRNAKLRGFEPKGAFTTAVDGLTIYVKFIGDAEGSDEQD